jgi:hypothetical protein
LIILTNIHTPYRRMEGGGCHTFGPPTVTLFERRGQMLCRELKGLNSDVFEGMTMGHIVALAPREVDFEIINHADDIAKQCGKTPVEVLKVYYHNIRPHIEFLEIEDNGFLETIRSQMRDGDDAPFVVLYFENKPLGIVTNDKDIIEFEGTKCFGMKEVGTIHVNCRKRETVMLISFSSLFMFVEFIKMVFSFIKNLISLVRKYPLVFLSGGLIYLIFHSQINSKIKELCGDKWDQFKDAWVETLKIGGPYIVALITEMALRISETNEEKKELLKMNGANRSLKMKKVNQFESVPLSQIVGHLFLALKCPLKYAQIKKHLEFIGFKTNIENNLRQQLSKVLSQKSIFYRDSRGFYNVVS